MRYPRNAKIFRGQLDAAPFAAVFFLFVGFLLLSSLVYTPGVLIELNSAGAIHSAAKIITVTSKGDILFRGKTFTEKDMDQLRATIKTSGPEPLAIQADPAAPKNIAEKIRELLRIDPPGLTGFSGTDGPTLVVAVNLRGQVFWENQMLSENALREALRQKLATLSEQAKDATLVLLADKAVENETLVRLSGVARESGINKVLLATKPSVLAEHPDLNQK